MALRPQCGKCPWRNPEALRDDDVGRRALAYAQKGGRGFMCHVRLGPCDGPDHANISDDQPV